MYTHGIASNDQLEGNELIQSVIADISIPSDEKLAAFSPVLVNILRQWIA